MSEKHGLPPPYEVIAGAGITPRSTHEEVLDRALEMQAQGRFTSEMRVAWDQVRIPQQRLAIDFFLICHDGLSITERAAKAARTLGISAPPRPEA